MPPMMIPPTTLLRRRLLGRSQETVGERGGDIGGHLDQHGDAIAFDDLAVVAFDDGADAIGAVVLMVLTH